MSLTIGRRHFLAGSAAAAGALLLGTREAGASDAAKLVGYTEIDPALFAGVNRVADTANPTGLEKKHAPVIGAPGRVKAGEPFDVKVSVGGIVHPMGPVHYIQYVEVYAGNEPAGRVELSPQFGVPTATLTLRLDKPVTLVVRAYCNRHGLWECRVDVAPA